MTTDTQGFKTVATFTERTLADMCVALLGDNGIPAGVFGADSSYPSLSFARNMEVKVNEIDAQGRINLIRNDITYSEAPRHNDGGFRRPPRRNSQD